MVVISATRVNARVTDMKATPVCYTVGTHNSQLACMYVYVCMYESFCNAPLLQPKQSRVLARKPNRKDVSLACYRKVSVSMLDQELTVAESSTVLEHKQQSCVVQNW